MAALAPSDSLCASDHCGDERHALGHVRIASPVYLQAANASATNQTGGLPSESFSSTSFFISLSQAFTRLRLRLLLETVSVSLLDFWY